MDNLRWILLFAGLGLIGLMLAWHTWRTWPRDAPRRGDTGMHNGDDDHDAPVHVRAPAGASRRPSGERLDPNDAMDPRAAADTADAGTASAGEPRVADKDPEASRWSQASASGAGHLPAGSLDDPLFRDDDARGQRWDEAEFDAPDDAFEVAETPRARGKANDDRKIVLKVEDDEIRAHEPQAERRDTLHDWTARLQSALQRLRRSSLEGRGARKSQREASAERDPGSRRDAAAAAEDSRFDEFGVSAPRVVGGRPAGADDEKILLLHVVAPPNRPFTGIAVDASLKRVGLEAGAMDIFHRYPDGPNGVDYTAFPLVSVANMVAPGTLAPQDLSELSTPGLALFVQVHRVDDPFAAFLTLLETADALKRELHATILDVNRATATNQTLAAMRDDMQRWLLQHRPDVLRRAHSNG